MRKRPPIDAEVIIDGRTFRVTGFYYGGSPDIGPRWDHGGIQGDPAQIENMTMFLIRGKKSRLLDYEKFEKLYEKAEGMILENYGE